MMLAKVTKAYPRWQLITHHLVGGKGEQHLPSVSSGEQPRYPVDRRAEVITVSLLCRACVQSHPHPKRTGLLPSLGQERALGLQGCLKRIRGSRKASAEGITDRLEDVATTLLYGASQDLIVAGEGDLHRRRVSLPHLGGTLYVGEHECDSACGRARHNPMILLGFP
jgi:hypothetical protein